MRRSLHLFFAVSQFLLLGSAHALVSTDTLPLGVRAVGVVYGQSGKVTHSFQEKDSGEVSSIVQDLNRSVTLEDIAAQYPKGSDLLKLQKAINDLDPSNRYGDRLLLANLYGSLEVHEKHFVTGFLYGVTPKWSLGMIVPVIKRSVKTEFRVESVNNAQAIRETLGCQPEICDGLREIENTNLDTALFEDAIFASKGYSTPRSFEKTVLGDVQIENRYRFFEVDDHKLALRSWLTLPTSTHKPDPTNLLDQPISDRVAAVKFGPAYNFQIVPHRIYLHSGTFLTFQAPTREEVTLPAAGSSEILGDRNNPEENETALHSRGPRFDSDLALSVDFWKGVVNLSVSHLYQKKWSDSYKGSKNLDYQRLERKSAKSLHSMEYAFELSSIPLFQDDLFGAPGKLIFAYNQPFRGVNTTYAPYARIDFIMLF